MTEYTYNQTIEYIDGTRDLNFEAARRWAQEHGTTFEEDVSKREPYTEKHIETYMNPETGAQEEREVNNPTIKRFFVIGDEPKPYVPTEDELKAQVRAVRDSYLQATDFTQLSDAPITDEERELYKQYREYLRTYPECEEWYRSNPKTYAEWKVLYEQATQDQLDAQGSATPDEDDANLAGVTPSQVDEA